MSYTALYRKYRPAGFEDVKGQDHIVTTLKNQLAADRIGHAYLFCGTRGTGKTTVAKIFAKAVNCEHRADGSPCGECESCRAIAAGASMNVIEIDAASNNGVDDVRQIREEVLYPPTLGRYKVYIIDEVHMLSAPAFNALLKTLEEPPAYVIFILATTEPQKLPVTILSRCQRYDFRRIPIDTIADRLRELMDEEGVTAEDRAIRYVARAADGSMRDALSLMDQCIAFYLGQELTLDRVLEVLGAVDTDVFSRMLRAVLIGDVTNSIGILEDVIARGGEPVQFADDFVWYLRNLLLIKSSDHMEDVLDMSSEQLAILKQEAQMVDDDSLMRYIRVFSELERQMKYAAGQRVLMEIALIRLCRPLMEGGDNALSERVALLERQMEKGVPAAAVAPKTEPAKKEPEPADETPAAPLPKAIPEEIKEVVTRWHALIRKMLPITKRYLEMAHLSLGGDNSLLLVYDDENACEYISKTVGVEEIQDAISGQIGRDISVVVQKNDTGRPNGEIYPDLAGLIHMEIVEDEDF